MASGEQASMGTWQPPSRMARKKAKKGNQALLLLQHGWTVMRRNMLIERGQTQKAMSYVSCPGVKYPEQAKAQRQKAD